MKKNKNLYISLAAATAVLLLNLFAVVPLYQTVASDVVYMSGFLPDILEILTNLLELSFIAAFHAVLIFVVLRREKSGKGAIIGFSAVLFSSYILRLAITLFDQKVLEVLDFVSAVIYFSIDTLIILAVYIFAIRNRPAHEKNPPAFAEGRFFTLKNPFKLCIGFSALLLALIRILSRVVFDITYGAPKSLAEVIIMVCFYLSDILLGAAAYVIEYFVMSKLHTTNDH